MTTVPALLEVDNVFVQFGGLTALQGVSLRVQSGEVVGLIGPNGSGKSTLLNAISGLVATAGGDIRLDGASITNRPAHERARLGLCRTLQGATSFAEMDAAENVVVGGHRSDKHYLWRACLPVVHERFLAASRQSAIDRLRAVGLEARARTEAGSLAYGEQRRLDVARSLAGMGRLLLLDEPVAGLNLQEIRRIDEIVGRFRRDGGSVILVEHKLRFVMDLSDRVIVLDFGRKIAEGSPDQVRSDDQVIQAYLGTGLSK